MSQWRVGLDVKFVAGPHLSAAALRVLATAGRVYSADEVRTSNYILPPGFVRLDKLTIDGSAAEVAVLKGPVPVRATLACGTGLFVRLRRDGEGWAFDDELATVC